MNAFVSFLLGGDSSHPKNDATQKKKKNADKPSPKNKKPLKSTRSTVEADSEMIGAPCCSKDPVDRLEKIKKMASVLEHEMDSNTSQNKLDMEVDMDVDDDFVDNLPLEDTEGDLGVDDEHDDAEKDHIDGNAPEEDEEQKRLVKMGINTAIAIGLHNFPEGLATFVAALDDPRVGGVLAMAIAIHNIPEGLCVALPIYYATGKRFNAFMWALLSGASEVLAALLGWAILANSFSNDLYAVLFAMVAGMMVIISVRELLPTAHFYDPEDTVVTHSFISGMVLMASSLILFKI
jgi:zinc transporter ZupT